MKRLAARCDLPGLANDVCLTVVPIGGFTQRHRIENAAWTFEKILRAEISIAALLDRDYRCTEEIADILASVRGTVPNFYILGAKEIENYLLVPRAIGRAIEERLKERKAAGAALAGTGADQIENRLLECTERLKPSVLGQLVAHRMRFFSGRTRKDPASVAAEAVAQLELDWRSPAQRFRIVPGKDVLSALNADLQREMQISITPTQILRHLSATDAPDELKVILRELDHFATS